jgi:serine/threonine protein phosphatase PrpC
MAAAVNPKHELKAAAAHLVSLANARDGSDNVSVQIIRIKSVESVGMYRGRLYKLPKARYE